MAYQVGNIAGDCPKCARDELLFLAQKVDGEGDVLNDLTPMCLDINFCTWVGKMTLQEETCGACFEKIPAGAPAMYTRFLGEQMAEG